MIENVPPSDSSNILRVTGDVKIRKALSKGKLKPLGATMARYIEERYNTLPFARDGHSLCLANLPRGGRRVPEKEMESSDQEVDIDQVPRGLQRTQGCR